MTLPSRGAASLAAQLVAIIPLAPGMFWLMMVGLPGRCFSRCAERTRA
jgi:hypothetical protein